MKIGFFGLLQIVFVVLKLLDKIDWSWWLVLSPVWTWIVIFLCVCTFIAWMDVKDPAWRFRK